MSKRAKFDPSKVTVESEQMTTPIPSTNPMAGPGAAISPPIVERDGYIVPEANRGVTPADVQRGMRSRVAAAIPPEQFGPPSPRTPRGMDAAGQAMIGALTGNQAQMRAGMAGIPAAEPNMPVPTFGFTRPDRPAPPNVSTGRSKAAPTQNQFAQSDWRRMSTSLEGQGLGGGQTPATFGSDPYAQMRQRTDVLPSKQQQTYGGQTVRPPAIAFEDLSQRTIEQYFPTQEEQRMAFDPRRSMEYSDAMARAGIAVNASGQVASMPATGMWGGQGTSGMPSPAPTMAPGAPSGFAQRRGLEGAAAAMQAPRTAAERIENQPNLFERMTAAKEGSPERQRLERQFNALPADAQAAQQARGGPQAQPQYQPGQIVGSGQYGSAIVGAAGAQMPYVQDPMNPQAGALPVSAGMTRDQYMSNISSGQRQSIRSMLVEQGGPIADQLQQIERQRQSLTTSPAMRGRDGAPRPYVGPQEQMLQQQEDDLIYGAMRDPSAMMSGRQRMAAERQRMEAAGARESQVAQERALAEQQKYNANLWKRAEAEVDAAIKQNAWDAPSENERLQRIFRKFAEAGGQQQALMGNGQVGAGPGAGMMQPPAMGPAESGAPDFSAQELIVEQPPDVDFEQTQSGNWMARLPDNQIMKAIPWNGELLVFPQSRVEEAALPPGTRYIKPGPAARGEDKIEVKSGQADGPSAAARVAPEVESATIKTAATAKAKERSSAVSQYRSQLDEYNRLMVDARRTAVEAFNKKYGTATNSQLLKVDTAGNPNFNSTAMRDRFGPESEVDPRGAYEAEVNAAMMEAVKARYQDGKVPSWVNRVGTEITGVSEPQPPKGYQRTLYERVIGGDVDARSTFSALPLEEQERQRAAYESQAPEEGQVGPQDIMAARQEYFQGIGAQPEMVSAERLISEASRVWRTPVMRDGRRTLTFQNRPIPAVNVRIGGVGATLPKPETAEQAVGLLLSGRPFAIEQDGMMLPFKMDRSNPMVQAIYNEPNKSISAVKGAAQSNRGAVAARDLVDQSFGYLPQNVRNTIIQALLAHAGYNLTG